MMREVDTPLEVIQQRMGHALIRTTADIYGSLPESIDQGVAAQLDELFRSARGVSSPHRSARGADVVQMWCNDRSTDRTRPSALALTWGLSWLVEVTGLEPATSTLRT